MPLCGSAKMCSTGKRVEMRFWLRVGTGRGFLGLAVKRSFDCALAGSGGCAACITFRLSKQASGRKHRKPCALDKNRSLQVSTHIRKGAILAPLPLMHVPCRTQRTNAPLRRRWLLRKRRNCSTQLLELWGAQCIAL